jgi:predicted DNA-binding protein (UPF0251 family)
MGLEGDDGQPVKWRRIGRLPESKYFVPAGDLPETEPTNRLKLEELEAIRPQGPRRARSGRLCGANAGFAADVRAHFAGRKEQARRRSVNGKAVAIEGGNFTRNICPMRCAVCGHIWDESVERATGGAGKYVCPKCGSEQIVCAGQRNGCGYHGNCRRHGWREGGRPDGGDAF